MDNQQAELLYKKYLAGSCTEEEQAFIEKWYLNETDKRQKDHLEVDDDKVKTEIWAELEQRTGARRTGIVRRWHLYTAAAAILIVVFLGVLFYGNMPEDLEKNSTAVNQIKPGRSTATLTLANGEKIILSDAENGELARQAGVLIRKDADGKLVYDLQSNRAAEVEKTETWNTLATARGEEYQVILPDGTKVWLNASSSVRYPTAFKGATRHVELSGEAYFEVAKDKQKPFLVKVKSVTIEVLGTHFNVMSYADEGELKTTLLEGGVKVVSSKAQNILSPGQQAIVNSRGQIDVQKVDVEGAVAWKRGYFKFDKQDLPFIMRQLGRWYDMEVVYEGEVPNDVFVGKIRRSENISEVLKIFELSQVKYQIKGRKIIIKS